MTIDECVTLVLDPFGEPWITLAYEPGFIGELQKRLRREEISLEWVDEQGPLTSWAALLSTMSERLRLADAEDDSLDSWKDYMGDASYWEGTPILANGFVICFSHVADFCFGDREEIDELKDWLTHTNAFAWRHSSKIVKIISSESPGDDIPRIRRRCWMFDEGYPDTREELGWMNRCLVCGRRHAFPMWEEVLDARTLGHCECCGCEFGVDDRKLLAIRNHRMEWLGGTLKHTGFAEDPAPGLPRWRREEQRPPDWDIRSQMLHIPGQFL